MPKLAIFCVCEKTRIAEQSVTDNQLYNAITASLSLLLFLLIYFVFIYCL